MQHVVPANRHKVSFSSFEELIAPDEPVRLLDAFAEKQDLAKLGFRMKPSQEEGRPSFAPRFLLKLYLYGYQHGIRSPSPVGAKKQTKYRDAMALRVTISCSSLLF